MLMLAEGKRKLRNEIFIDKRRDPIVQGNICAGFFGLQ